MTSATKAPLPTPEKYLKSLRREPTALGRNAILYYPGSGIDYGPFRLFAENSKVTKVIYADYVVSEHAVRHFITHLPGWQLEGKIESLEPGFFSASHWRDFWPEDPQFIGETGPQNAFALRAKLSSSTKSVQFIFLGTEASETYRVLANCNLLPTAMVLQNCWHLGAGPHGFGEGSALHNQARNAGLPQLLLVAANTGPWPGYEQTSEFTVLEGQMCNHPRALFRRMLQNPA